MESVVIEVLTNTLNLSPLVIAATSSLLAGGILLLISCVKEGPSVLSVFKNWRFLVPSSMFLSLGLFSFFDSIRNAGASKVALLSGPLEVVVVILFARVFLAERLSKIQLIGVTIALSGFLVTISTDTSVLSDQPILWGDVEATLSAILLAGGVIFAAKLMKMHSTVSVTGSLLLISGLILLIALSTSGTSDITLTKLMILLIFSLLPLSVAMTYMAGVARIGVSLTSIIGSLSILLTVGIQIGLSLFDVRVILPANMPLAVIGGIFGIMGIFLVNRGNPAQALQA